MAKIEEIDGPFRIPGQTKAIIGAAFLALTVLIVLSFVYTGVDRVEPGEAAVVINNISHNQSVVTEVGYVIHLPFGMTEVHKFNTEDKILLMSGKRVQGQMGGDAIRVKTRDGSNVDLDAEIKYRLPRQEEALKNLAHCFGSDRTYDKKVSDLLVAFARSDIREILGELYIYEITDASQRQAKAIEVRSKLNEAMGAYGVNVDSVSILNLDLNDEYEKLIKDRKDADQLFVNQASAIESALQQQAEQIARTTREKNTALEEEKGRQTKRIIEAIGQSKQMKARADGDADRTRIDGDKAYEVALNEARAVEAEGLAKAEGILKLAGAYERGGMALVREALAEKYLGRTINGRPYDLSSTVERLALEPSTVGAAAAGKGGPQK
jgi:regulator of protease activity HflC (stomatin/prohibitin superfamily)